MIAIEVLVEVAIATAEAEINSLKLKDNTKEDIVSSFFLSFVKVVLPVNVSV